MPFLPLILLLFSCGVIHAQQNETVTHYAAGVSYGFGSEFNNKDYSYTNRYIQAQAYYTFNPGRKWEYRVALMPEVNFARHQLLNVYFVLPDRPGFIWRREELLKLKDIREYILNVAFFVSRKINEDINVYAMLNVGPMITDTDTERLNKGFAFCDVFAIGASYSLGDVVLDVRPNVRHISNAGLQDSNAGFNTYNLALCIIVPL